MRVYSDLFNLRNVIFGITRPNYSVFLGTKDIDKVDGYQSLRRKEPHFSFGKVKKISF